MDSAGQSFLAGAHHDLVRGKQFAIDFDGPKRDNGCRRDSIGQPEFDAIVIVLQTVFLIEAPEQCCWNRQDDTSLYDCYNFCGFRSELRHCSSIKNNTKDIKSAQPSVSR